MHRIILDYSYYIFGENLSELPVVHEGTSRTMEWDQARLFFPEIIWQRCVSLQTL